MAIIPRVAAAFKKDPWQALSQFTPARIALGRAGTSLTTAAHLAFQLAHARARDAVSLPLDFVMLEKALQDAGLQTIQLHTQASNRLVYLQRPDKGRLLAPSSVDRVTDLAAQMTGPDIAIIVADGLSSKALQQHARPFLEILMPALRTRKYSASPICLVQQGRVAVADHVGELLSAAMSAILIGERPGLSSPDSMGVYFTYGPNRKRTDAHRNCISNIHARGLNYETALEKLLFLIAEANRLQLSGVHLKDDMRSEVRDPDPGPNPNFLID